MAGPWRVFSQVLGDRRVYIAGRQIDPAQPLHGGNVEYRGCYIEDRAAVEQQVSDLNAQGESAARLDEILAAVAYALKGAKIENLTGRIDPNGVILLDALKITTIDGHSLLLSQIDDGIKIFRFDNLYTPAKSVFDWIKKDGDVAE